MQQENVFTPPSVGRRGSQEIQYLERLTRGVSSYRELLAAHLLFYINNGERSLVAASSRPGHHLLHKVLYNNAWWREFSELEKAERS